MRQGRFQSFFSRAVKTASAASSLSLADSLSLIKPLFSPTAVVLTPQRKQTWPLNKQRYRQCNQSERLFRRLKAYRRVFTRYDKLDLMFAAFVSLALITEHLR